MEPARSAGVNTVIPRALLSAALLLGLASPALAQSCPTATTPAFTSGGNVFGRIASQWNAYFGAKADANNGTICNPNLTGTITFNGAVPPSSGVAPIFVSGGAVGINIAAELAVSGGNLGIADNGVTNAKLATLPPHTYKGNNTGATATPLDITSAQLLTDLNLAGNLPAIQTNTNPAATAVGAPISTVVASPGTTLTNATAADVGTISLTAGNWIVHGNTCFLPGASTSITLIVTGINTVLNTLPAIGAEGFFRQPMSAFVPTAANDFCLPTGSVRFSLSTTTTIHLVAAGTFTVSTLSAFGTISAERAP